MITFTIGQLLALIIWVDKMIDLNDLMNTYICHRCYCLFYNNEDSYVIKPYCKNCEQININLVK